VVLASGMEGDVDALPIRAHARVLGATLAAGESVAYTPGAGRHLYLVPARGTVEVNGVRIEARDGAAVSGEDRLQVRALQDAEIVMVDSV
jgi:redox-sensitive bicupin YhaK (pirin superfamily)